VFEIVEKPIVLDDLVTAVADPQAGATTTFIGTTRATNRGRAVERLEYEAYADMAVTEFQKLAERAEAKWELCKTAIVHRVGVVALGEASIVIAVSAPHRRESIEACHFLIDGLKEVAPIWKKEYFEGGEVWIGSLADCLHDHDPDDDHVQDRAGE
jgi:molybdopterin synthase catalytic subunit